MTTDQEIKQQLIFEDDKGYLHDMSVESKNEDNRTVTGWTTIFRNGERHRVKVTVPDHRLRS